MSTPAFPPPPPPASNKKGPLFWILIGIGSLVLIGGLIIAAGTFFVYRTMQKAGVSTEDFKNNPALAGARVAISVNPDLEVVSEEPDGQSIRVRVKSTGQIMIMRINPQTGAMEMTDEKGGSVKIDPRTGKVEVQGKDGESTEFGSGVDAKLPAWLPAYPGTEPKGLMSAKTPEGDSLSITFKTSDSSQKVLDFYEERLKAGGFTIATRTALPTGGMLLAEDSAKKRQAVITMGAGGEVMIQTQEKN